MSNTSRLVNPLRHSTAVVQQPRPLEVSVLHVDGPLHARQGAELRKEIQARLNRGGRTMVLSLAGVPKVDAAGVGELVRAYNMTVAAGGRFRVTQVTSRVREVLDRVGLFEILTAKA